MSEERLVRVDVGFERLRGFRSLLLSVLARLLGKAGAVRPLDATATSGTLACFNDAAD
jgi:hypothetical protein